MLGGLRKRVRSHIGLIVGAGAVVLLSFWLCAQWALASVPGSAIRYVYTPDSQLAAIIKPEAEAALYAWDAAGNLSSIARKSSTKLSIIEVEPTKGVVGETVDIWGTGFSTTTSNNTVKFHGMAATVTAATAYMLAVKVPSGATSGTVTVQTTTEGPVTSSQSFTVANVGAPTITSISSSVAEPGATITMSGTNFETTGSDDVVRVNEAMVELLSETSTSIKFKVPGVASSGRVTISTPQGSATGPVLYIPPPGYTTSQVGPTAVLTFGSATAMSITTAKTIGLAVIEAKAGEALSAVLSHATLGEGWAYVYTPQYLQLPVEKVFGSFLEESFLEPVALSTTGTYTIMLKPLGEETGSVKVTPYSVSNVKGSLSPTTSGVSEVVSLPTPGDTATYTVSGSAGEEVSLKTTETTFTGAYRLEWLSPEGKDLGASESSGNKVMEAVRFPTAGTYKLVVKPSGTVTGSTKLTAYTAVTANVTPTKTGESKTLTMSLPDQNGDITFSGTEGQMVSFVLSEITVGEVWVSIYSPNGEKLAPVQAFSKGSEPLVGPFTLPATGTYTMVIAPQKEDTGSVKVTAYTFTNVTGSLSPTASEAVSLPTPGQIATYSVSEKTSEEVSLKTTETTLSGQYWLEWFNPEGKYITAYTAVGNGFMDSVAFPTTGMYKLVVKPEGTVTGSTKLTAYNSTAAKATIKPTSGGESTTITTTVPGQNGLVTLSGSEKEEVSFVLSEITIGEVWVTIYKPTGEKIYGTYAYRKGEEPTIGPLALPETSTYTIELDTQKEGTGSVKVTAYIGSPPHGLILKRNPLGVASTASPARSAPSGALGATGRQDSHRETVKSRRYTKGVLVAPARLHHVAPLPLSVQSFRPAVGAQWHPSAKARLGWGTGLSPSPWASLPSPTVAVGTTALAGQALKLNGLPLAGLRVSIENTTARATTDASGQFVLQGIPAGHDVLVVEGSRIGHARYGTFEIGVQVAAGKQTTLDAPIWMTPLDPAGNSRIASPTKRPVVIRTPRIPGLEVRLPAGTVIHDAAGHVVRDLNITAVPVDRPPFPLPFFAEVPLYFTVQPGRAYLSKGAQIVYPNYTHMPAGSRVDFWNYDPAGRGWYIYGHGSVTTNGKQIVPDPGVKVWEFTGSMVSKTGKPSGRGGRPGAGAGSGDPVDLSTGLFDYRRTDLVIPDTIPIVIERTYAQASTNNSYSFGVGTTSLYDMHLWSENNYHEADLVLPDGSTVLYKRVSAGEGFKEAEYKATETPGVFYDSTIKWDESVPGWDLTLTDGTTYVFGELAPLQAIRNRQGQQLTITREAGQNGNITQITSPHGHWVKFSYNSSNDITEIKDDGGRTLKYAYNSSGLLESAIDPAERTTKYEYNSSNDMTSITDPRGNKYLEIAYNSNDRVSKQTNIGGGTYEFSYTTNLAGGVESTTVTEPLGNKHKVTFNSEGYPTSETFGLGSAVEQTGTIERQAGTGFVLSTTDARGRKTAYEYDSYGNVTAVTRLAGTSSAQTYKYSYEPDTTELTKETDPLGHSTTYEYNSLGELIARKDALGHTAHIEYNGDGQPAVYTNPLGKKTTITYEFGYPVAVTDPLGRTAKQFVDALGRVVVSTEPGGQRTLYEYNKDNQVTKITDPLGNVTSYEYDGDGDLTAVTDPLKHKTKYAYTSMGLLESETDALEHKTTAVYDTEGNMTQLTDRRGKVAKFTYDALNRLTEAKYGVSGETAESTIKYEYDNGNRLTKVSDSTSGTYTPEYDELNRLKSLATPQGTIKYEYDEANRRTGMTVPGQEALKYTYDEANRLTELKRGSQTVSFAYNEANLPTKTTLVDGVEEQYGYDEANELTSIAYKKGSTTLGELDYSFDLDGRKEALWGSYARTALPEALSSAKYNADNEQTERGSKKLSYDLDGDLTSDGTSEYKWNARGQLTTVTGPTNATYTYDPFGHRTSRTIGSTTTELLNDGPNVVQESQKGSVTANLLTGLSPNKVFARTTSKTTENLLTDQLGSTIGLAGSTGSVETTYTYDPFGTTTHEGTASENTIQYAGQENDGDGLYDNRARYYSPAAARFISQDPLGQEGSGPNVYLYTSDDPTNMTDPYGTSLHPPEPGGGSGNGGGAGGGGAGGAGAGGVGGAGGAGASGGGAGGAGFGPGTGCGNSGHSKGPGLAAGGSWLKAARCHTEELERVEEENQKEEQDEKEKEEWFKDSLLNTYHSLGKGDGACSQYTRCMEPIQTGYDGYQCLDGDDCESFSQDISEW